MVTVSRWGLLYKRESWAPLAPGADRSGREAATAIWANIRQLRVNTVGAKGALICADARSRIIGSEVPIAIFTVGSELQSH